MAQTYQTPETTPNPIRRQNQGVLTPPSGTAVHPIDLTGPDWADSFELTPTHFNDLFDQFIDLASQQPETSQEGSINNTGVVGSVGHK